MQESSEIGDKWAAQNTHMFKIIGQFCNKTLCWRTKPLKIETKYVAENVYLVIAELFEMYRNLCLKKTTLI